MLKNLKNLSIILASAIVIIFVGCSDSEDVATAPSTDGVILNTFLISPPADSCNCFTTRPNIASVLIINNGDASAYNLRTFIKTDCGMRSVPTVVTELAPGQQTVVSTIFRGCNPSIEVTFSETKLPS